MSGATHASSAQRCGLALAAALLASACGGKRAARECDDECRPRVTEYAPTPMEVPIVDDYARAAEKRVGPDTYRRELTRVERELSELEPDGPESGRH